MPETVYGIGESKSRHEVYTTDETYSKTETYNKTETYGKAETYSKTEADTKFMTNAGGAPKSHASTANTYGLGTATNYGHVKLTTSTAVPSGDMDGIGLAGSMGYVLKKYTDDSIAALVMPRLPVGAAVLDSGYYTTQEMSARMGYGTWERKGQMEYTRDGSVYAVYIYIRQS
jgi:hypothetical protein